MLTKQNRETFGEVYLTGTTEQDAFSYDVGEAMIFHISLIGDGEVTGCPLFKWSINCDDGTESSGQTSGENGEVTVTAKIGVPGYVRLCVTVCDADGDAIDGIAQYAGGACAGFDEIHTTTPEPDDFDAFWSSQVTQLDAVPPTLLEKKPYASGDDRFDAFDIKFACFDSAYVSGILTVPKDAKPHSLPVVLTYPGSGVFSQFPDCKEGRATLSVNAHPIPNGMPEDFYRRIERDEIGYYGFDAEQNKNRETVYFRRMILRDVQAVRFMKTLPEWDGEHIYLEGGSQGGALVIETAALCPEVTEVNPAWAPWLCDLRGYTTGRLRGEVMDYTDAMAYYDTAFFAKRVRCKTLITGGLGDDICTPAGVTAAYNALTCEKTIILTQNRTHCYYPPDPRGYKKES